MKYHHEIKMILASLFFSIFLIACGRPISPQAQALLNMKNAFCQTGDLSSAKQFVTNDSQGLLEAGQALMPFAKLFANSNLTDEFAKECQNPPKIINEIRVNNERFLIQYIDVSGQHEVPVVLENNSWKVKLF